MTPAGRPGHVGRGATSDDRTARPPAYRGGGPGPVDATVGTKVSLTCENLFGQYKRITNRYESGVLTGKGIQWGGSALRVEATGYGTVFFLQKMLEAGGTSLDGRTCLAEIMGDIHDTCHDTADEYGFPGNYVRGANIAGFHRVADAMVALGLV